MIGVRTSGLSLPKMGSRSFVFLTRLHSACKPSVHFSLLPQTVRLSKVTKNHIKAPPLLMHMCLLSGQYMSWIFVHGALIAVQLRGATRNSCTILLLPDDSATWRSKTTSGGLGKGEYVILPVDVLLWAMLSDMRV